MKRYIRSSSVDEQHLSGVSFDFIVPEGGYRYRELERELEDAFDGIGLEFLGFDARAVDYSGYPDYADKVISQGDVDFSWYGHTYDESIICDAIDTALANLDCELIGNPDFYSLEK